jgi:hypothetical protein
MPEVTIQLSEEAATELAAALQAPPPEPTAAAYDEAIISVSGGVMTTRKLDGFVGVTRVSAGVFDFELVVDMPNLHYAPILTGRVGTGSPALRCEEPVSTKVFRVTCWNNTTVADPNFLSAKILR